MHSKDFKRLSLDNLRGKWGSVILSMLTALAVLAAISIISDFLSQIAALLQPNTHRMLSFVLYIPIVIASIVFSIIGIGITASMSYGVYTYSLNFVRYGQTDIRYIFCGFSYGFKTMLKSFLLYLLMSIFTMLWSLLFIVPGIIAALSYSQAFYILSDNDDISAYEALKQSKEMMRGYKGKLFCLKLSFIGWIILSVITCGIGFIFLMPYITTAEANFHEYLRGIRENS